jgi:UDP-N-acetylglucosamine 2-epimerase (non-hydrolysing)/GDP/UDP-N,N'-diacetylbacillosamine 2-epimerase (hydrolysing)
MTRQRHICAVSGSRADFGILYWPLKELHDDPGFAVEIALTGMHLAGDFGDTARTVEQSGIPIGPRVETLLAGDNATAMTKAVGLGVIGFADAWAGRRPDLVLLLGDRFETFAAAQAAYIARIPIAHLCGGDVTEGALDEGFRHAISKLACLHFTTNEAASARLIRMGEDPSHVHTVGSPALDHLRRAPLMSRDEVGTALGWRWRPRNLLITFHPPTLDPTPAMHQFEELLAALADLGPDVGLIFTAPNADTSGREMLARLRAFVAGRENAMLRESLGQSLYLGTLAQVDAVVGNSSSGLYEAPSLKRPTVNIGNRQDGRPRAASVVDCPSERGAIAGALARAFALDCGGAVNPYGDGDSARRIRAILAGTGDFSMLLRKRFRDA